MMLRYDGADPLPQQPGEPLAAFYTRVGDTITLRPHQIDYADPGHVPYMVAEAMLTRVGNLAECLADAEYHAACVAALDAMPGGRVAVLGAVEDTARHLAAVNGWSEFTSAPAVVEGRPDG